MLENRVISCHLRTSMSVICLPSSVICPNPKLVTTTRNPQSPTFQYYYFRFLTPETRHLKPFLLDFKHHVTRHPYTLEIKSFYSNPIPAIFDDFIHLSVGTLLV